MKNEHISVYKHNGIDIYTLKIANPSKGDSFKYFTFNKNILDKQEFDTVQDAIDAIEKDCECE